MNVVAETFDAFISYSRADGAAVRKLVDDLRTRYALTLWLDVEELPPGSIFNEHIVRALNATNRAVICIGPRGYGPFQTLEVDKAVSRTVETHSRFQLIPVLLPGVDAPPGNLLGVDRATWVSCDDDPDPVRRLCWGITGVKPEERHAGVASSRAEPPATSAAIDSALMNLATSLSSKEQKLTFAVGSGVCSPPSAYDLSRELLEELEVIRPEDVFLPPLDLAASYYAAKFEASDLQLLTRVFEVYNRRRQEVPAPLTRLVELLKELNRRPLPRSLDAPRPLVVTTNFDLQIERALVLAGVSFTRVVQHRSAPQIDVNEYFVESSDDCVTFKTWTDLTDQAGRARRIDGSRFELRPSDFASRHDFLLELDDLIGSHQHRAIEFPQGQRFDASENPLAALSLKSPALPGDPDGAPPRRHPWVVLYKHHGSQDIEGSCSISVDHHLEFVRETVQKGNIPKELLTHIRDSSVLFLGYSFLDPALRLLYNTLLHDRVRKRDNRLYLVQTQPATDQDKLERRIECVLWHGLERTAQIQMEVQTIADSETRFLRRLREHLDARLKAAGR